jgi:hypothetical protein
MRLRTSLELAHCVLAYWLPDVKTYLGTERVFICILGAMATPNLVKQSLCTIGATLLSFCTSHAAPVAVRFVEGSAHGFLLLRSSVGDTLGHGEQLQVQRNGAIESRLVFRFKDGSLHEDVVLFTQHKVFTLQNYRLVQRGPSFPKPLNVSFNRTSGQYTIKYRKENNRPEETEQGRLDLPPDVYNGMQSIVIKNLPDKSTATVHVIAFTPKPKIIQVELTQAGEDRFTLGGVQKKARHLLLKPKLGVLGPVASLFGKHPPDYHYWIGNGEAPAFLAFEGPFYVDGPIWRVELTTPELPRPYVSRFQ